MERRSLTVPKVKCIRRSKTCQTRQTDVRMSAVHARITELQGEINGSDLTRQRHNQYGTGRPTNPTPLPRPLALQLERRRRHASTLHRPTVHVMPSCWAVNHRRDADTASRHRRLYCQSHSFTMRSQASAFHKLADAE